MDKQAEPAIKVSMNICGRQIPLTDLAAYVNFLRGASIQAKRLGVQSYEDERARLHNRLFLVAGFRDTKWGTARKTACWFATFDQEMIKLADDVGFDQELVDFSRALDAVIGELL